VLNSHLIQLEDPKPIKATNTTNNYKQTKRTIQNAQTMHVIMKRINRAKQTQTKQHDEHQNNRAMRDLDRPARNGGSIIGQNQLTRLLGAGIFAQTAGSGSKPEPRRAAATVSSA
jgi:hypothetical protein